MNTNITKRERWTARGTGQIVNEHNAVVADVRMFKHLLVLASAQDMLSVLRSFPGFGADADAADAWSQRMRAVVRQATKPLGAA